MRIRPDARVPVGPFATVSGSGIRVVLADDHTLLREGLKLLLNLQAGVIVMAETDCVSAVSELLTRHACDVLVLGLGLARHSLADVSLLSERTRILVVCEATRIEDAVAVLRAGAHGAILNRASVGTLLAALHAVAAGQVWMAPEMQTRLADTFQGDPQRRLTPRECEIVRHVARGLRNAEVAKSLFITEQTVKTHLSHIFRKTGARDRVELALYAARLGMIVLATQG